MKLPDFPSDAYLQFMTMNREGEWRGFRIRLDRRLLRTSREGQWQEDTPLDEARMNAVRQAVDAADLRLLAEVRYGEDPPPDDATGWALHTRLDQTVMMGGLGATPASVNGLIGAISTQLSP